MTKKEMIVKGINIWPLCKTLIFNKEKKYKKISKIKVIARQAIKFKKSLKEIKIANLIYGSRSWLKEYDFLVFSDSSERRLKLDGKYIDKSVDCLVGIIGRDKALVIEKPYPFHLEENNVWSENIVSQSLLDIATLIVMPFIFFKKEEYKMMLNLQRQYSGEIDFVWYMKRFFAENIVFRFVLKRYSPKLIYVNTRGKTPAIFNAARDYSIISVEIAHGRGMCDVGQSYSEEPTTYFPNWILVQGNFSVNDFKNKNGFPIKRVVPVGSIINSNSIDEYVQPQFFQKLENKFQKFISVGIQHTEEWLIREVLEIAPNNPTVCFLLMPRSKNGYGIDIKSNVENVYTVPIDDKKDINFYNINFFCTAHMTVYSTTCFDSIAQGVPVIIFNYDYAALRFLNGIDHEEGVTVVDNRDSANMAIKTIDKIAKNGSINQNIVKHDYLNNLEKFIGEIA